MKVLTALLIVSTLFLSCIYPGSCVRAWGHRSWGIGNVAIWTFWLVIVALILYMLIHRTSESEGKDTPLDILKKRYAKGEIEKEEFDRMKKDLE